VLERARNCVHWSLHSSGSFARPDIHVALGVGGHGATASTVIDTADPSDSVPANSRGTATME